jgi:hypothetical protein
LPPLVLSAAIDWAGIATEFTLAVLFFTRRKLPVAIGLGVVWHSVLLLVAGTTFGLFYYAMLISFLAFIRWPASLVLRYSGTQGLGDRLRALLAYFDVDGRLEWVPMGLPAAHSNASPAGDVASLRSGDGNRTYSGKRAYLAAAAFTPVTYYVALALAMIVLPRGGLLLHQFLTTLR